jgi:hypothetical protein
MPGSYSGRIGWGLGVGQKPLPIHRSLRKSGGEVSGSPEVWGFVSSPVGQERSNKVFHECLGHERIHCNISSYGDRRSAGETYPGSSWRGPPSRALGSEAGNRLAEGFRMGPPSTPRIMFGVLYRALHASARHSRLILQGNLALFWAALPQYGTPLHDYYKLARVQSSEGAGSRVRPPGQDSRYAGRCFCFAHHIGRCTFTPTSREEAVKNL